MSFPAVIDLAAIPAGAGFQLNGVAPDDRVLRVGLAGDLNGDGFQDLFVGSYRADGAAGATYIVYGTQAGFPTTLELSALDGDNGFKLAGASGSLSAYSIAGVGDFNGDGIADLLVGGSASVVLFGREEGFDATVSVDSLTAEQGFVTFTGLPGLAVVAAAGDVNGDGLDDVIVAAPQASKVYVVFGRDDGAASVNAPDLDGTDGFEIVGEMPGDLTGRTIDTGDFNGDGYSDILITSGSFLDTSTYVLFGKAGGFETVDLTNIGPGDGFVFVGEAGSGTGISAAFVGDLNDDDYEDIAFGAPLTAGGGAAYVVFGTSAGVPAQIAAGDLTGANGFAIHAPLPGGALGFVGASRGDLNGDGYDDLIVGNYSGDEGGTNAGAAYVIFGGAAFDAAIDLTALDGSNGFRIDGAADEDSLGGSVSGAGDINGDGIDDLIVSAAGADPNGRTNAGAAYVIYGQAQLLNFGGTAGNDVFRGGMLDDTISGLGGKDVLNGRQGEDLIDGGADNDVLSGGEGGDDLLGGLGNDILNGDDGDDALDGGAGADKLNGGLGTDHLTGGVGADQLSGGDGGDTLDGGADNDLLDGGAGADGMTGGLGNDVFIVDDAGDQTIEAAGEGYDIVRTALDGWVLGANFEGLELQGSADIDGSGNALANQLTGNDGANTLSGLAGVDTITGGDGNDIIIGGLGGDLLRGGADADTFVVLQESVGNAALETDTVYDYSAGDGDRIDLSAIDADSTQQGNQAFTLAESGFTRTAGEMTLTFASGQTTLKLDVNGDGKADYQMKINGDVTHESGGWLL
jgi:hypothetical protein